MWFGSEQYAKVDKFGVRAKDERENDRNHLVETTFEINLTHELADEILPAAAKDLYNLVKGQQIPKPEVKQLTFDIAPDKQLLTVRTHPDLEPVFQVAGVTLRKIVAKKTDGGQFVLIFTTTWQLGLDNEAMTMIRALKSGVYLTFQVQQPDMLDPGQQPENIDEAKVDSTGNVASIEKGRKKKRGRQSPEAEQAAQAEHAAQAGDEPPAEEAATH